MRKVEREITSFVDKVGEISPSERNENLKGVVNLLESAWKHAEEKVTLAALTCEMVGG